MKRIGMLAAYPVRLIYSSSFALALLNIQTFGIGSSLL